MNKIIAAFDGLRFSESTRDYAVSLAKANGTQLEGLFLEDRTYHSYNLYDLITEDAGGMATKRRHLNKKDEKKRASSVVNFVNTCNANGIDFNIHKVRSIAILELLKECIYADLLVIQGNETLSHHAEHPPTKFIRNILSEIESPVMLVPAQFRPISKLLLLFDEEVSSVHAFKMFSYTLPGLKKLPIELVTVRNDRQSLHTANPGLIAEFSKGHFQSPSFITRSGITAAEIVTFINQQAGNPLVVLGAPQGGKINHWFSTSIANKLIKVLKFPLFIAFSK